MICSVVYGFRAISFSPRQSSEIAIFAQSNWTRYRGAGHREPRTLNWSTLKEWFLALEEGRLWQRARQAVRFHAA